MALRLIRTYASFVKFSHTVFALPFAIAAMAMAYAAGTGEPAVGADLGWNRLPEPLEFSWRTLGLILAVMVAARSFAMSVNRILDLPIDALNPRTATRELPSGRLSLPFAWAFVAAAATLYFGACWLLGEVVLWLSPVPVVAMVYYPYTKRFTWACHFVLGVCLGLAPVGAWVAVRAPLLGWSAVTEPLPWVLGAAVAAWVAGFDIIYALQDDEFDRAHGLHSIPARFGRKFSLWLSLRLHYYVAIGCLGGVHLALLGVMDNLSILAPVPMLAGIFWQHRLVKPDDLSRVNVAFFTVNGLISLTYGAIVVTAWLLP
jgi:4-hydroxybenzoate polyprenyltransferase